MESNSAELTPSAPRAPQPWKAVDERATELDADPIAIGYRGQGHERTDRIGSVAERIGRTANRPVLTA